MPAARSTWPTAMPAKPVDVASTALPDAQATAPIHRVGLRPTRSDR